MKKDNTTAIKVNNLTKKYGDFLALDNISFAVKRGEIFGYLGPNGAGKTTTINILTTLLKPTSGSASIFGNDIMRDTFKARKPISVMLQDMSLDPFLNSYNNLYFFSLLQKIPKSKRKEIIDNVMENLDLSSKKKLTIFQLSHGLVRRLQIATMFMSKAELIFLDEPTLGVDIQGKIKIWNLLKEKVKKERLTVFLATNDITEAEYLCDRIAFISEGKIIGAGIPEKLKKKTRKLRMQIRLKSNIKDPILDLPSDTTILRQEDNYLEIEFSKIDSVFTNIIGQIQKQSEIEDMEIKKPTIQDVFLELMKKGK